MRWLKLLGFGGGRDVLPPPPRRKGGAANPAPAGLVFDVNGRPRQLGALVARGGEGSVWSLEGNPGALVKIYHPSIRKRRMEAGLEAKLQAMLSMRPLAGDGRFAWPRALVFDDKGKLLGYAMRRLDGFTLQTLCVPQLVRERLPGWGRRNLAAAAHSLVSGVEALHRKGVVMGDINPANFLLSADGGVAFIDCDSYQIEAGGRVFPCPVGVPALLAPELLRPSRLGESRTVESELFSLAVMVFKILTVGLHPYSHAYGSDPVANLKSGACPLGLGADCRMPRGPWYAIWSHLPYRIKSLFIAAFRDGHANPSATPGTRQWLEALDLYAAEIAKGFHSDEVFPSKPKEGRYHGKERIAA